MNAAQTRRVVAIAVLFSLQMAGCASSSTKDSGGGGLNGVWKRSDFACENGKMGTLGNLNKVHGETGQDMEVMKIADNKVEILHRSWQNREHKGGFCELKVNQTWELAADHYKVVDTETNKSGTKCTKWDGNSVLSGQEQQFDINGDVLRFYMDSPVSETKNKASGLCSGGARAIFTYERVKTPAE